ncbi:MAG TPA: hypothetical protein VK811_03985 [Candidatus Acidoferrum sp.]|jgi:hypothetical protein|nr:hypothetical protein [Candidatus Acidoferrum sp.]
MLKWTAIALLCVLLINGCATQNSQPDIPSTSSTSISLSANTNVENIDPSVSVTGFSNYDEIVLSRISNTWYKMLKDENGVLDQDGKEVIKFKLHSDGTISNIKTIRDDYGWPLHYFCIRAIKKNTPFPKWTSAMIKKLGTYLDVQLTFDYHTQ